MAATRNLRRAWLVVAWLLIVPALAFDPALAIAQTDVGLRIGRQVAAAKNHYAQSTAALIAVRRQQRTLEQRISDLKRSGQRGPALDRLLKQSVNAEAVLDQQRRTLRQAESALASELSKGIRAIDVEIRRFVPDLKQGPMSSRKQAARRINELRALRHMLRADSAKLANARKRARAWAQYRVQFNISDGPSELSEKADFVEDTRDKVNRKRLALITLLSEARQERQIAQAAQDFRTDITLFDEETRQGRVLRQNRTAAGNVNRADSENLPPSPSPGQTPVDLSDQPPSGGAQFSQHTTDPMLRAINPDVLINLRVEDVAAGALDVATLQRYVEDLQALERFLSGQAESLRQRAQSLEADEAKDLHK
ncbi:MAG: hypothetical protein AAFV29_08595 [Myxococcota bacterium]